MNHIENNAILHYEHLVEQGQGAEKALDHTARRFGVVPATLRKRVSGEVADPKATREALAEARKYITGEIFWVYADASEIMDVLRRLYVAVTGETDPRG